MAKHPLLQKKANNGLLVPADGRTREDINRVLNESKAGTGKMRMAAWNVTIRDDKGNTRTVRTNAETFKGAEKAAQKKLKPGEMVQGATVASKTASRYSIFTGPTIVKQTADILRQNGINVTIEGTENVIFEDPDQDDQSVTLRLRKILGPQWGLRGVRKLATSAAPNDINAVLTRIKTNGPATTQDIAKGLGWTHEKAYGVLRELQTTGLLGVNKMRWNIKLMASKKASWEVGDDVKANMGNGQFFRGEIESVEGDKAIVSNGKLKKTVPLANLEVARPVQFIPAQTKSEPMGSMKPDDYCEACGQDVANRECEHGILCDSCDAEIHGQVGGECKVGSADEDHEVRKEDFIVSDTCLARKRSEHKKCTMSGCGCSCHKRAAVDPEAMTECPKCGTPLKQKELIEHLNRHSPVPSRREAPPSSRFTPEGRRSFHSSAKNVPKKPSLDSHPELPPNDENDPLCICGRRFYDHEEDGRVYQDASRNVELCSGFAPVEGTDNSVHLGAADDAYVYECKDCPFHGSWDEAQEQKTVGHENFKQVVFDGKKHRAAALPKQRQVDKQYPDSATGAIEALAYLSSFDTVGATARPDPSVEGVWMVTMKTGEQAIVYLKGYKDPLHKIRETNDFEEVEPKTGSIKAARRPSAKDYEAAAREVFGFIPEGTPIGDHESYVEDYATAMNQTPGGPQYSPDLLNDYVIRLMEKHVKTGHGDGVQECCGAFAPNHKPNCKKYNDNFSETINRLRSLPKRSTDLEQLAMKHQDHDSMCNLGDPVCKAYTDMRIQDPGWYPMVRRRNPATGRNDELEVQKIMREQGVDRSTAQVLYREQMDEERRTAHAAAAPAPALAPQDTHYHNWRGQEACICGTQRCKGYGRHTQLRCNKEAVQDGYCDSHQGQKHSMASKKFTAKLLTKRAGATDFWNVSKGKDAQTAFNDLVREAEAEHGLNKGTPAQSIPSRAFL